MSEKRKDNKGRVLKTGESQRKDSTYQYRYTDIRGKRRYVYAPTLAELRQKEQNIRMDIEDGIDYEAGESTVFDLAKKYVSQKQGGKKHTETGYQFVLNLLSKEEFSSQKIKSVKPSDGKAFFIKLHNDGRKYGTICAVRNVLNPAFKMAVEDDIVRRNPFIFSLSSIIPNDSTTGEALTGEEKKKFLAYVLSKESSRKHFSEIIILLGTGLRVSELCGLTITDVDLQNQRIKVDKQLLYTEHCEYYVNPPKTNSGIRYIPILDETVYQAFQQVLKNRKPPKIEYMIDGYTGFLFLTKTGKPKLSYHIQDAIRRIVRNYNASHDDKLPNITPHTFRHTFCTELENAGVDIKSIQYLMGHSDVKTTLNRYAHSSYETARQALAKIAVNR